MEFRITSGDCLQRWQLRYAHADVDPFWAAAVDADLDAGLVLLATLVQPEAGETVGQATIGFERAPRRADVVRAFARQGIVATPIDAAAQPQPPHRLEPGSALAH